MERLIRAASEHKVGRRAFLGWSAAAAGAAALFGSQTGLLKIGPQAAQAAAQPEEGKWVAAACWHNCGGRCLNKVLIRDGVVVRQKTDDTHPDSPDTPQQRGCARGRSQRQQVLGADRLKYPMKRKNWEPGGGKKELRGKDEWVRISWEEALDLVAAEMLRVKEQYGNKAIIMPRRNSKLVHAFGGGLESWGVTSDGAWPAVTANMVGSQPANDRLDWRNAKLLVLWGANPAWSSSGNPAYNLLQVKKAGAKIICVDPMYSATAQALADEWIPVRPGTDAALLIGMAYHMITNSLQDQAFLDRYTVGFDRNHMPEGADPKENFRDYVLGTYDGVPKTPEWASAICGTDPRTIRSFAQQLATTKPAIMSSSSAPARTHLGQQYCQAFLTVGWMTGNLGTSGGGVWQNYHSGQSYSTQSLVRSGGTGAGSIPNPIFPYGTYGFSAPEKNDWYGMAHEEMYSAILNGEYTRGVNGKEKCDIRLLYCIRDTNGGNFLNQEGGINEGIEAMRKLDFIVTTDIVLSTQSKYADIVLPECTWWEKAGTTLSGNPEALFVFGKVIEPLYETQDAIWMERELAKRLGLDPDEIHPISREQQYFNQLAGATVIKPDASGYEPLVTITAEDIAELGVEGKPQQGRISIKELKERGVYQVERRPGDAFSNFIAHKAFREDPEKNRLKTRSGKLEIHCQALSDKIGAYGFTTCPPIPMYRPPVDGFEATYADYDKKTKGEYPLQFFTPHYLRRSHSVFDNVRQLREAFPQECWMNPVDAEARGIRTGDTVKITSKAGTVLRPVELTERVVPGTVALGEGAWVERDDETGIDKAGATNSVTRSLLSGQGEEPWNTVVCQVEKWTGEPLTPDHTWPQRIIF